MKHGEFTLSELSRRTGIKERTIRSYVEQGLLRGPETVGRHASYSRHHLDRLQAVRVLRDQEGLSLSEIRQRFVTLSDGDIAAIAARLGDSAWEASHSAGEVTGESALDYIRALRQKIRAEPESNVYSSLKASAPVPAGLPDHGSHAAFVSHSAPPPQRRASARRTPGLNFWSGGATQSNSDTWDDLVGEKTVEAKNVGRSQRPNDPDAIEKECLELRRALSQLRDRERVLQDKLSEAQASVRRVHLSGEQADLAATGSVQIESLVRIAILPDVEILVRGGADEQRLERLQLLAEQLRQALAEDSDHD